MKAWSNHFLDFVSPQDIEILRPGLTRVTLQRDDLLARAASPVEAIFLPVNCVVSVVAVMSDGRSVETRTIGCESGFGLLHALGSRMSFEQVTCQLPGDAWRIPLDQLAEAAQRSPGLVKLIAQHSQATMLQAAQSAACNTLHTAEQRLCRWLLLTSERVGAPVLPLTQEHLSIMLGVQRTTVTAIASELQAQGLVSYSRGKITILDHAGLLRHSCECYEAIEHAGQMMLRDGRDGRAPKHR